MNNEVIVEIKERLGVIKTNGNGWTKELSIVSWNGNPYKYDIREWSPDHTRMTRGITLSSDEMQLLVQAYGQHKDKSVK